MAFDLSSPVAKLAFEMALRNQQAQDSSAPFDASARSFVSQALSRGNEQLSDYEDIYRQYVDPAEAQRRAQAAAFNEYLIGLPELLAKSAQERRGSGGTGSPDVDTTNLSNYEDRFVVPSAHREYANDVFGERGGCGFTFGDGCSPASPAEALFGGRATSTYQVPPARQRPDRERA
jgi:hypothetical protein